MDAIGLLGSLMGNGGVGAGGGGGGGGGGGMLGSLIGGAMGGGAGGMLGNATGSGKMGVLGNVLGGAMGGSRGGGSKLMGVLGGLAVAAVTKYARGKMSGGDAPEPGGLMDIDPDEALASTGYDNDEANSRAEILIRAMVNAAKSDGHVDEQEQQNILQRVGDVGQEEMDFLRNELSSPLDTEGFIRAIPQGMEKEVYAMSLMGIELDESAEAQYLAQLAEGLGLSGDDCNEIHRELGAPEIFS